MIGRTGAFLLSYHSSLIPIELYPKGKDAKMRVLGIDPGLATMGWGIVDTEGSRVRYVAAGALITRPEERLPERLLSVFSGTRDLLNLYRPDEIAFEELFFAKNITTGIAVGHARGCTLCACAEYGKPMYEYTPMQIKQSVTGYGKADKHQMQHMVSLLLGLDDIIRPDDAADAVAAALTHIQAGRMKEQYLMK